MVPFGLYRVAGESMLPKYCSGDLLVGQRWFIKPVQGDVVVVLVENKVLIKRIKTIEGDKLELAGDNPSASTDSRSFGLVKSTAIQAKIITWKKPSFRLEK